MTPWGVVQLMDSMDQDLVKPSSSDEEPFYPMIYMLNLRVDVNPDFYDVNAPMYPLTLDRYLRFIKRSSRCVEKTLSHAETKRVYATLREIDVNVDPLTRRPAAFPEWWRNTFTQVAPSDGQRHEIIFPEKPGKKTFKSSQRIVFSDTDENRHTNFIVYIRACCDAFSENVLAGNYGNGIDVYDAKLQTLEITFRSDSKLGDILVIESWQDLTDTNRFCFEVRNGNDICVTTTLKFYAREMKSVNVTSRL